MTLLDEILANPRPTSLRLVYADQLLERGDPRGEFIQLACAPGKRTDERRARYAELLAQLTAEWKARKLEVVFDRGFVRKARGSAAAMIAAADALAREPIDELQVAPHAELATLLALPTLARVSTLDLGHQLGDAGARALADSALPGLRSLRIFPGPLSRATAHALGRAPWAKRLGQLALAGGSNTIDPEVLADDAALTALEIDACPLGADAGDIVRRAPQLQSLRLFANRLGLAGMRSLAAVPLPRLANLELRFQELHEYGVRALAESTAWPMLRRLAIAANRAGDAAITALAQSPVCAHLVELDVGDNALTSRGVRALAASPHLANLKFLDLRWIIAIDDEAVAALLAGLPSLERLGITSLTPEQRAMFSARPSLRLL